MKMRASLAKLVVCGSVTLLIPAFLLFFFSQRKNAQSQRELSRHSDPAANAKSNLESATDTAAWMAAYGKLPASFEENLGQADSRVRFLSRGSGYDLFLTSQEVVLSLRRPQAVDAPPLRRSASLKTLRKTRAAARTSILRMRLANANVSPEIAGVNRLPEKVDYFIGNNPKNWRTDVPAYARVKYQEIYPGVDLVFYGNQRHLEYDFVVAPGADPSPIAFDVQGARRIRINPQGNLVIAVPQGEVEFQKPVAYQEVKGQRREIAAAFALTPAHRVSFAVSDYDKTQPLVVDPVLDYSTYLGGSTDDFGFGIAVDASGDAFVAGGTTSTDFPTTAANAFNSGPPAGTNTGSAFVTEMNPTGTALLYSTYLSGDASEQAIGIAVDPTGKVYVTGQTFSTNFPATAVNAFNPGPVNPNPNGLAFVSKLDPTLIKGASLVYSSYLGGTGGDAGNGIAVDANGNAYIVGLTLSSDFPVFPNPGAFQATLNSTSGNAFLSRIDTTKSGAASLIYSTYLGGTGIGTGTATFGDSANGVAVDAANNAYIAGTTTSTDFPTTANAFRQAPFAAAAGGAVFVSRINTNNPQATALIYSTYLAGAVISGNGDFGLAIGLGPSNVAYVTGSTDSADFPVTPGAFQATLAGTADAFVSLIDTGQSGNASLKYSTFLGGTDTETGSGIQADGQGVAYVAGATASADFPVTPGALEQSRASNSGDGFIAKLNPGGNDASDLIYSTYFGGSGGASTDSVNAIAIDSASPPNVYVTGQTFSADYPVFPPAAFQTSLKGASDAFVGKLTPQPTLVVAPLSITFTPAQLIGTPVTQFVTLTNNTGSPLVYTLTIVGGTNPLDFTAAPGGATPCAAGTLAASPAPCTIGVTFKPSVNGPETSSLVIGYVAFGIAGSQTVKLAGTGTNTALSLAPSNLVFGGQLVTTTSAAQPVTLTNSTNAAVALTIGTTGDFGQTNTCAGNSVPANSNCTINVTFSPTGTANPRAGTLTVTANGQQLMTTLSGTGWDFALAAQASITVADGSSGNFPLNVNGLGGFTGPVTLACTGAPLKATCTVLPSPTNASGPAATVTITTAALLPPSGSPIVPPGSLRPVALLLLAVLLLFFLPATRRLRTRLGLVGAALVFIILAGCSGHVGTPRGTSTLTLTGTSATGNVSHSTTVQLTVN